MKRYTLDELKTFWDDYENKKVMRVLKNGEWELVTLDGRSRQHIDATRAELVAVKKVKTFIEYLEGL